MKTRRYIPNTNKKTLVKKNALSAPDQGKGKRFGKRPPLNTQHHSTNKYEIDYFHLYESLYRKEVTDWQQARIARYDPFRPITMPIQQLYKDAMLDNHLQGAIENRILRVVNKEFVLKDANDQVDLKRSKYIQTRWFRQMVRRAMESIFYGYSMCFIDDFSSGDIRKIKDIPRENIIPEYGLLLKEAHNIQGESIDYTQFPNFLIYIQLRPDAVGILERITPMTIYKRHSWASWDEFEQIFGVPIRIARTMINTEKHKNELQSWLETMGTASYAIFDKQVDIEVKENQKSDSFNVFMQKISMINKEISKGVVGQTMTMDDGSSQSQAEVHQQTYQEITDADIMEVQDWASDDFLPVMRALGYDIPEGYYIEAREKTVIKPKDKIKIDGELLRSGVRLTKKYIEDTYDVEIEEMPEDGNTDSESLSFFD
ncbi:DUF935 family protein [Dysgonomonas sp. 520]|uniref:phage portal protein family protein n=1 Tax=Dysgonomonas sp. 520 TaxID=2302931 RepID=UPI0013D34AE0|nr:DUF935 family protein [Dysgonomonas sp. 520]NDW10464.1 DUF935 family protein [Dysgonomonas sp. 520]